MKTLINVLSLILALIAAIIGYFSAWSYFWTYWKDSPFGYETCGLEGLVWIFVIPEALIISFVLKVILVNIFNYPRIFWVYPLIAGALLSLFYCDKGWGQGLMAALFIICELIIAVYSFINRTKTLKQET